MSVAGIGLPGGLVTFLFTDIEKSTRLLSALGPDYDPVLDLHHETLRGVWAEHRGHEINTEGDAFFVSFASADDAVAACAAAQRALADARWPSEVEVRVRMGLHTGYATPRNGDYSALAVNQAARVVGAAHGGQVFLTSETVAALDDATASAIESLGRFRVRDFDGPVELFSLRAHGWLDPGRPPRVRPADRHNLVPFLTSMVDRQSDRAWLDAAVGPGTLTTITGPGGGGKTRLAIEFGLDAATGWADGVWFVDLSLLRSADHVAEAVADAVGAVPTPGAPVIEDAREHLLDRTLLIVLDNCEHVVEAVARLVHDLQSTCAGLGVLATSRLPLGLAHERMLRLAPLPYDGVESPAVELFFSTATDLPDDQRPTVQALCERLDGIPLALELAAARTRSVSPAEILERLESDQDVVRSTDPTRPDRHQSLDSVLDWSWDLLGPVEQAALRRLAVLAGTFDMATAVVAASDDSIAGDDVPELVWTLLDHSLIVADVASGASRYRVLTPVRTYALGRSDAGESVRTVQSLAVHFESSFGRGRVGSRTWVSEMSVELDNVRGVVRDLVDTGEDELGQSLAWAVGRFHDLANAYATALEEIGNALAGFPDETPSRVSLLALRSYVLLRMVRKAEAEVSLAEAERLAAIVGVPTWDGAAVVRVQGEVALRSDDPRSAVALAHDALEVTTDPAARSRLWNLLGLARAGQGDVAGAAEAFERELSSAMDAGLEASLSKAHGNLAEASMQLGMWTLAAQHQLAALESARSEGQPVQVAFAVMVAARLLANRADEGVAAATLHESALQTLRDAGHVLYDVDAESGDVFRRELVDRVGTSAYARAEAAGQATPLTDAADRAAEVLKEVIEEGENHVQD